MPRVDHLGHDDPPPGHWCCRLRPRACSRCRRSRVPHKDPNLLTHLDTRGQLQDVNLAEVVTTAQAPAATAPTVCRPRGAATRPAVDNTARHAGGARPQFKVVYAYAADRPNRFAGWKDALQANVAIVQRFLSAQDGGTKGVRFDMGTGCGPQYVDIQFVQLPGARAAYADNFSAISSAVAARRRQPPAGRATRSCSPTASRAPRRSTASARP